MKLFHALICFFIAIPLACAVFLKTPAAPRFDKDTIYQKAQDYQVRIIRDAYGVPHIYGERDVDVAFGLAYAHGEDDWETIEEVLRFSRGVSAVKSGRDGAIFDFLIGAFRINEAVKEEFEEALKPELQALTHAYATGANLYCADHPGACAPDILPVTAYDVTAGFAARTPFFYGLEEYLTALFDGELIAEEGARARQSFLRVPPGFETGSNAMAVAPARSADGHTRLMVNSHQPYDGPVAWYEARLHSNEGWDIIGGLFPGAPMVLHGAGPDLGWAFTVNKPDLVDVFALTVDHLRSPTRYLMDGEWMDLERWLVRFRVKLWGPFSLPVSRPAYRSVHGPVFKTDKGFFAVSFAGDGDVGAITQWFEFNKAKNFTQWREALAQLHIPSFNIVYGDREGNIAYYYNAAIPVRKAGVDWTKIQPGDDSALVWNGTRDISEIPSVVNPESGYVVNANHTPYQSSGPSDNPDPANFPPHYGVDEANTNRGLRIQQLYGGDASITNEEFLAYKMDARYAQTSRLMELVEELVAEYDNSDNDDVKAAIDLLRGWDGNVTKDSREAALAIFTARRARGALLNDRDVDVPDRLAALTQTIEQFQQQYDRIDPKWGDVVRLKRGEFSLPLNGGPDTLRAVYPFGDAEDGTIAAAGGDTYILYADWDAAGDLALQTIHQYGAITSHPEEPHYASQAELFANEQWKTPPMDLDDLLVEMTSDKTIGGATLNSAN